MAKKSVGAGSALFNLPASVSTVFDQDAAFWRAHAQWREAEDAFESGPHYGDEPEGELLANMWDELRCAMFTQQISTATALAAKFEAMNEGQESILITDEMTIIEALRRDCQHLADLEAQRAAED
jgi:hypothetical protein